MANEQYLDISGLTHFKQKMDDSNESKFVKNSELDSIIKSKLTNIYTYKGSVGSFDELPKSGNKVGDVYDVSDGMNYAWDGTKWDALGATTVSADSYLSDESVNPVQNKVIKAALDKKANVEDVKTYSVFTRSEDGMVPHPLTDTTTRYLREDGSWEIPPDTIVVYNAIATNEIDELFD